MIKLEDKIDFYKDKVDKYLTDIFDGLSKNGLSDAMRYSVLNGGKRLRPVLMLMAGEALNVDTEKALPFACAIEIMHSSSLVHDDLPALDNDDLRRGKPSCHKKFGEAEAILCGDALLNLAYEICAKNISSQEEIECFKVFSTYSGINGMLGGQYADITCEKNKVYNAELLSYVQNNKTAKLITAPLVMASCLSGNKYKENLLNYGLNLGVAFQIVDDILDSEGDERLGKTVGKDFYSGKLTDIVVYGIKKSKERAKNYTEKAISYIKEEKIFSFLIEYAYKLIERVK